MYGVFAGISYKNQPNAGTPYIDPMGYLFKKTQCPMTQLQPLEK